MTDRIGQTFGNYQLIQFLGRGGFADVYLGKHYHLGTETAIKILHTHLQVSDESSFLTEARTIASLEHSNIVRILDFDIQEGIPFLVMSYASNGTSRHRHPKGTRLPASLVGEYVKPLASALQYAHDQKIIHRDIKPENILLGRNDEPLLTDFGLAITAQSTHLQSTQKVVGTAYYMAPEQFQGKPRFASDQYSLAVVIYEWLTGERPFQGSFIELYSQHLSAPPPSIREKVPTVSLDLERVIHIAMSKNPAQRFGSIRAFATAFEQALSSATPASFARVVNSTDPTIIATPIAPTIAATPAPVKPDPLVSSSSPAQSSSLQPPTFTPPAHLPPATPEPLDTPPSRPLEKSDQASPRRGISRRVVIAGAALMVAGGIGIWSFSAFGGRNPERSKLVYTYKGHTGLVSALDWSPDSKKIASGGLDDTVHVWNATDGSVLYVYRGHSDWVNALAWSSDGNRIASCSSDDTVQIWNAADGGAPYAYSGHTGTVHTLAWSPDGKRIASCSTDKTVQIWGATNGNALYTYRGHTGSVDALTWSPDGKRIASGSANTTVHVWNATDGSAPFIYSGYAGSVDTLVWSPDGKYIASGGNDRTVHVWHALDS